MDNFREDLKEKNIDLTRIGETTRSKRGLEKSCKSLTIISLMEDRKEEKKIHRYKVTHKYTCSCI